MVNFSYGEQNRLIRPRLKYNDDDNNGQETLKLISNCEMYDINYRQVLTGLEIPKQNSSSSSSTLSSSSSSVFIPIKKCSPISGWVYNRNQFRENAAMHVSFLDKNLNNFCIGNIS